MINWQMLNWRNSGNWGAYFFFLFNKVIKMSYNKTLPQNLLGNTLLLLLHSKQWKRLEMDGKIVTRRELLDHRNVSVVKLGIIQDEYVK